MKAHAARDILKYRKMRKGIGLLEDHTDTTADIYTIGHIVEYIFRT